MQLIPCKSIHLSIFAFLQAMLRCWPASNSRCDSCPLERLHRHCLHPIATKIELPNWSLKQLSLGIPLADVFASNAFRCKKRNFESLLLWYMMLIQYSISNLSVAVWSESRVWKINYLAKQISAVICWGNTSRVLLGRMSFNMSDPNIAKISWDPNFSGAKSG